MENHHIQWKNPLHQNSILMCVYHRLFSGKISENVQSPLKSHDLDRLDNQKPWVKSPFPGEIWPSTAAPPGPRPSNHSNHWLGPPRRLWWLWAAREIPRSMGRELEAGTKWKSFPYFWWLIRNGYIDSVDGVSCFFFFSCPVRGLPWKKSITDVLTELV